MKVGLEPWLGSKALKLFSAPLARSIWQMPTVAASILPKDEAVLDRGKIVFAENCARCHSSKQPPRRLSRGPRPSGSQMQCCKTIFYEGNFLSDDEKYPVSEIGTNAERALATNAERGQIWEQFSSESYKTSPPVHVTGLVDPLHPSLRLPACRGDRRTRILSHSVVGECVGDRAVPA